MISAIVCVDNNWGIGYKGELLEYIPEDIKFFKEKTTNNVVIMGRKTYESMMSKPLPYRTNIVITSRISSPCEVCEIDENGTIFMTIDFVKLYLSTLHSDNPIDYYIIGGGQLYKELLPYCSKSYVTKINNSFKNVDTYFPNLDNEKEWTETESGEGKMYYGIQYKFCIYEKV